MTLGIPPRSLLIVSMIKAVDPFASVTFESGELVILSCGGEFRGSDPDKVLREAYHTTLDVVALTKKLIQ